MKPTITNLNDDIKINDLCRASDGSQKWVKFIPSPAGGPTGKYQFTPNQTYALYPQLATTRPFVIKSVKDFDTEGGPSKIPSAQYDADYKLSATIGNANSSLQTKALKDTAKFWEDGASKQYVSIFWIDLKKLIWLRIKLMDTIMY